MAFKLELSKMHMSSAFTPIDVILFECRNYSKIASTIPRRKTVGRRGSIFGVCPVRASLVMNPDE
jgi:hypothetical protein